MAFSIRNVESLSTKKMKSTRDVLQSRKMVIMPWKRVKRVDSGRGEIATDLLSAEEFGPAHVNGMQ